MAGKKKKKKEFFFFFFLGMASPAPLLGPAAIGIELTCIIFIIFILLDSGADDYGSLERGSGTFFPFFPFFFFFFLLV